MVAVPIYIRLVSLRRKNQNRPYYPGNNKICILIILHNVPLTILYNVYIILYSLEFSPGKSFLRLKKTPFDILNAYKISLNLLVKKMNFS
jgi:hypothetical protein